MSVIKKPRIKQSVIKGSGQNFNKHKINRYKLPRATTDTTSSDIMHMSYDCMPSIDKKNDRH